MKKYLYIVVGLFIISSFTACSKKEKIYIDDTKIEAKKEKAFKELKEETK